MMPEPKDAEKVNPPAEKADFQASLIKALQTPTVSKEFCEQLDALKQISNRDLRIRLN